MRYSQKIVFIIKLFRNFGFPKIKMNREKYIASYCDGTISLSNKIFDMGVHEILSVLLHEYIHFIQDLEGRLKNCEEYNNLAKDIPEFQKTITGQQFIFAKFVNKFQIEKEAVFIQLKVFDSFKSDFFDKNIFIENHVKDEFYKFDVNCWLENRSMKLSCDFK